MTNKIFEFVNSGKAGGQFAWMWLGQGGFAYRFGDVTIIVDPYLSDAVTSLPRAYPREVEPSDIAGDMLLTTHGHDDHFDPETIEYAVRKMGMVIGGPRSCHLLYQQRNLPEKQFIELRIGQEIEFKDVCITVVKAEHSSSHGLSDSVGYVLRGAGVTVYHVGDCDYTSEIVEQTNGLKPDFIVVPINGKWGNMNAHEAALLVQSTQARVAIPMHYDLFVGNQEDPQLFVQEMHVFGVHCDSLVPVRWIGQ